MLIGGIDIGTSGCKIALYDENGSFCGSVYKEYNVKRNKGLHEINPEEILESVQYILKKADTKDLKAIAVTSFGETFTMLDEYDAVCAPSMLYTDPRGEEECAVLIKEFGERELTFTTGAKPHSMYSLPKIMWIKNNMPQNFSKAKYILLMQDYIIYMLTGKRCIDYSLAARTTCFDIKNKKWSSGILNFCGIDENKFSIPVPSGTVVGIIKTDLAKKLDLPKDMKVITGCHDQIAAMTGANVFYPDEVMDGTGTVECVPVITEKAPQDYSLYECGYSVAPHINGKYACYALSYAGGASLKWFKSNISTHPDISYEKLDKAVTDSPTDLLIMPHFAGAATPYMDTSSKAAVIGLTFEHTGSDIYKALMEGTAYEIMLNLEILGRYGITPKKMIATGGGASSDIWLQIKADVLGIPIKALNSSEIGAAGTAYIAGRACGMYKEKTCLVNERKVFLPNPKKHQYYLKQFEKYKRIYNAAKEVMK